jgi:hypothetical protein
LKKSAEKRPEQSLREKRVFGKDPEGIIILLCRGAKRKFASI